MSEETIQTEKSSTPAAEAKNMDLVLPPSAAKKLDDDISFGIQQTLACFATDFFIDPFVGEKIQNNLGKVKIPTDFKTTATAEISGDLAALATFIGLQRFFPQIVNKLTKGFKSLAGGTYEKASQKILDQWANHRHVEKGSTLYNAKRDQLVTEQAEDAAKATVISTGSVVFNVATQKLWSKNPKELWVITLSKLSGVIITMAFTLGTRLIAPGVMHKIDEFMDTYMIDPVKRGAKAVYHMFGAKETPAPVQETIIQTIKKPAPDRIIQDNSASSRNVSHTQRVATQRVSAEAAPALIQ